MALPVAIPVIETPMQFDNEAARPVLIVSLCAEVIEAAFATSSVIDPDAAGW